MKNYFMRNRFTKAWQFADSLVSRGLKGEKAPDEVKDIREMSCHGSAELNIEPCTDRRESKKFAGSYYCGACNCGDFGHTQIKNINAEHYSKLDYPRVSCPKNMPGFNNYVPLTISENDMRKRLIEETFGIEYLAGLNEKKKETDK